MRKLLIVLFLFTLTSNALAKEEIWDCEGDYFKIDTGIPTVYMRQSKWFDLSNASDVKELMGDPGFSHIIFTYSREDESITWSRSDTKENLAVMDLFTKEYFEIKKDGTLNLVSACKLFQ